MSDTTSQTKPSGVVASLVEADAHQMPTPGTILQGRFHYRLGERLGKGGFGSVFRSVCLDTHSGAPDAPPEEVAIKILAGGAPDHAQSALKREISALLSIEHKNIPKVYDWRLDGNLQFVVMQYFPAGSLADVFPLVGSLNEAQTWRLLTDLLEALCAAHHASVLHLDVKPSNVLLDGNGGYVLTDFGVSQGSRVSQGLMSQGRFAYGLGTHGYRAPEQHNAEVESFDMRTDLWGVGATAWAMHTGIDLNKRRDVLRKREEGNVFGLKPLSEVRLSCPPPLEEIIMSMLFLDPALRPGGAAEVLSRIRAIVSGFGLASEVISASRRIDLKSLGALIDSLVDPLWIAICRTQGFESFIARFDAGEIISQAGVQTHHTYVLLRGSVAIEKNGEIVDVENREGTFLGEISTLTGSPQQVTLRAAEDLWACVLNESELERFITHHPAVAIRLLRSMAKRIAAGPPRQRGQ